MTWRQITALIAICVMSITAIAVASEWRRTARMEACQACVQKGSPGLCGPLCGLRPRAGPDVTCADEIPPDVGSGRGH